MKQALTMISVLALLMTMLSVILVPSVSSTANDEPSTRPTKDVTDTVVVHSNRTQATRVTTTTVFGTTATAYDPYKSLDYTPTTCAKRVVYDGWSDDCKDAVTTITTVKLTTAPTEVVITQCADGFTYYAVSNTEAIVCGYTDSSLDVVIPNEIDGLTVVGIHKYAFKGHRGIKTVSVPSSVGYIGYGAFSGCWSLESIALSEGLHTIGSYAFSTCYSLCSIDIPDTVTVLGDAAFSNCLSLADVDLPDGLLAISTGIFDTTALYADVGNWDGDVLYVDDHLIKAEGSLRHYMVRDGTRVINMEAFKNNSLQTIILPDSLIAIGGGAFRGCRNLSHVEIPGNVERIGGGAFFECAGLNTVIVEEGVRSIGAGAFAYCGVFQRVYDETTGRWMTEYVTAHLSLPASLEELAYRAFVNTRVVHLSFGGNQEDYDAWLAKWPVSDVCHVVQGAESVVVTHNADCTNESGVGTVYCETCAQNVGEFLDRIARHSFNGIDCEHCGILVETCFKSSHPYANVSDKVWTMRQDGLKAMKITFSPETYVEDGCDFITLYHADGSEIGTYTGVELANRTITVIGDCVMLRLTSNGTTNEYGFDVVAVEPVNNVNAEIGDLNADGGIDMRDAFVLYSAASGSAELTEWQKAAADMNGDGEIDMRDAFALYKIASGG